MDTIPSPLPLLTTLLPLVFTPVPEQLSEYLLARPTREAHRFLGCRPGESEFYCLPGATNNKEDVEREREKVVEASLDNTSLGRVTYTVQHESGEIRCLAPVNSRLMLILQWEAADKMEPTSGEVVNGAVHHDSKPSWRFLTLALSRSLFVTAQKSYPTLVGALEASLSATLTSKTNASTSRDPPLNDSNRSRPDSPPTAINISNGTRSGHDTVTKKKGKSKEEMAEGEGTTPGAYGAPEDFWDGWSSDGEESLGDDMNESLDREGGAEGGGEKGETPLHFSAVSLNGHQIVLQDSIKALNGSSLFVQGSHTRYGDEGNDDGTEDDDGYWDSYGGIESVVGEHREGELEKEYVGNQASVNVSSNPSPKPLARSRRSSTIKATSNSASTSPAQSFSIRHPASSIGGPVPSQSTAQDGIQAATLVPRSTFLNGHLRTDTEETVTDSLTPTLANKALFSNPTSLASASSSSQNRKSGAPISDNEEMRIEYFDTSPQGDEEMALRMALEGLWKLFSGFASEEPFSAARKAAKKQAWDRITREVSLN